MKKILMLVVLFVGLIHWQLAAQKTTSFKIPVSVSQQMQNNFKAGGRLLLHMTTQNEREPRLKSEITIGVTPKDWTGQKSFIINTNDPFVLVNGLEKFKVNEPVKWFCQVVYKQNEDDGNENVEGNLYSQVDSFLATEKPKFNLQLQSKIPALSIVNHPHVKTITIKSQLLSAFSKHDRYLKASILLPSSYFDNPNKSYPICYRAPGLNGRYDQVNGMLDNKEFSSWWFSKEAPQVIYVFLDSQGP